MLLRLLEVPLLRIDMALLHGLRGLHSKQIRLHFLVGHLLRQDLVMVVDGKFEALFCGYGFLLRVDRLGGQVRHNQHRVPLLVVDDDVHGRDHDFDHIVLGHS